MRDWASPIMPSPRSRPPPAHGSITATSPRCCIRRAIEETNSSTTNPTLVVPGLNPGIHHEMVLAKKMDRRVKPGDDDLSLRRAHYYLHAQPDTRAGSLLQAQRHEPQVAVRVRHREHDAFAASVLFQFIQPLLDVGDVGH